MHYHYIIADYCKGDDYEKNSHQRLSTASSAPSVALLAGPGWTQFLGKGLKSPGFSNAFLPVIGYNSVIQGAF